jgi:hypothetical protein
MADLAQPVAEIAGGKDGVRRRVGRQVVGEELVHALRDALWMARAEFRREPALLGRRRHRRDAAVLEELQPADHLGALVVGTARDRAENDQPVDPLRIAQRQGLRDQSTERETREMAFGDAARVPDPAHIGGEILERAGRDSARPAMTAQVEPHHGEMRLEQGRDLVPGLQVGADAMHQRDMRTLAGRHMVDVRG